MPAGFQTWLLEMQQSNISTLQGARDLQVIGRLQGQLEIIGNLLNIKQES